jgi:glucokinase
MRSGERTMLVGDVGGTHARFAIAEVSDSGPCRLHDWLDLEVNFESLTQGLSEYFARAGVKQIPTLAAIAVAGPVTAGQVTFTNRNLQISEQELKRRFKAALLINDFAALAFAADRLNEADLHTLGPQISGLDGEPISVVGAGTGFGVACLARFGSRAAPMATEGGHIGFAPGDDQEIELLRLLARQFGRVSVERILSGPGLQNLYRILAQMSGREASALSAAQVVECASSGDTNCRAALTMFCSIYGAVAGDIALAHGARGGVFIAGGIAQRIEPFLTQSAFRMRFESKGRLSEFVKSIPTRVIRNPHAALMGAARAALALRR